MNAQEISFQAGELGRFCQMISFSCCYLKNWFMQPWRCMGALPAWPGENLRVHSRGYQSPGHGLVCMLKMWSPKEFNG